MLKLLLTLESCFKRYYRNKSPEFQKGFQECFRLVEVGIEKHPQYNAFILVEQLEKEKLELQSQIRHRDKEIKKLSSKVKEKSLFSQTPTTWFREYEVRLSTEEKFTIIVNMQYETFLNMSTNFAARFSYTTSEEAKAMMLQYINSKSAQGFKAYKDEKTAIKDNVKIRK